VDAIAFGVTFVSNEYMGVGISVVSTLYSCEWMLFVFHKNGLVIWIFYSSTVYFVHMSNT